MSRDEPGKLLDYLSRSAEFFRARGVENPRLSAERLLCAVLDSRRIDLYLQFDRPLSPAEVSRYRELVRRRAQGEPLQYILGTTEFYGREFVVTRDTLVPRPETETLVEKVLSRMAGRAAPAVADVGTGCGCIAVTIALERPDARVIATDISEKALAVARRNAERHGVLERVDFRLGDLLSPLAGEPVQVVVANLPYVSYAERPSLPREVRDWEPEVALFAEDDGLAVISRFVAQAPKVVVAGGFVALEIAMGQAERVVALWHTFAPGWSVEVEEDLGGVKRIVIAAETGGCGTRKA